jgi:hypothetical protein
LIHGDSNPRDTREGIRQLCHAAFQPIATLFRDRARQTFDQPWPVFGDKGQNKRLHINHPVRRETQYCEA